MSNQLDKIKYELACIIDFSQNTIEELNRLVFFNNEAEKLVSEIIDVINEHRQSIEYQKNNYLLYDKKTITQFIKEAQAKTNTNGSDVEQ